MRILQPHGWPRPRGYSNGIEAEGKLVFVAGQIGWDETGKFKAATFGSQFRQALVNTLAVLEEASAKPEHITRMTWFITSRDEYAASLSELGAAWKELMGPPPKSKSKPPPSFPTTSTGITREDRNHRRWAGRALFGTADQEGAAGLGD
jgi:enamine deaminase RidA (YjgF/YER057c/UK114 family)